MSELVYTGQDNLEIMRLAKNYNRRLIAGVTRASEGRKHALDFGAGLGEFALPLRERGLVVDAIETDPSMRKMLEEKGMRVETRTDAFEDGRFDLIYTLNVLEHIQDDLGVLKEFRRILAPGGRLYVYVPALPMLWSTMDTKVGHVRRYTRKELKSRLEEAGFKADFVRYFDALGFAATLAYKVVGSSKGDLNPATIRFFDRFMFPVNTVLDPLMWRVGGKNLEAVASVA